MNRGVALLIKLSRAFIGALVLVAVAWHASVMSSHVDSGYSALVERGAVDSERAATVAEQLGVERPINLLIGGELVRVYLWVFIGLVLYACDVLLALTHWHGQSKATRNAAPAP